MTTVPLDLHTIYDGGETLYEAIRATPAGLYVRAIELVPAEPPWGYSLLIGFYESYTFDDVTRAKILAIIQAAVNDIAPATYSVEVAEGDMITTTRVIPRAKG